MLIDSVHYFNYTKEIGFYDSIRDFRLEKMTYVCSAISTPEIRVNTTPKVYKIDETGSNTIREYVVSELEHLKEIGEILAENSPKYILVCYADGTKRYYEYSEDFCNVFVLAKKYRTEENRENEYISPYVIQKTSISSNGYESFLQSSENPVANRSSDKSVQYRASSCSVHWKEKVTYWCKLISAFLLVAVIILIVGQAIKEKEKDSDLTPVKEPRSGEILSGVEAFGESEITIKASKREPCVVKLKNTHGTDVLSFYVRAGDVVTVGVPHEYLYVYFASGDTWYGEKLLFGEDTHYQKTKDVINFTEYTWECTLYPVKDGNLSLSKIDGDKF